jgi:hypothetical protein
MIYPTLHLPLMKRSKLSYRERNPKGMERARRNGGELFLSLTMASCSSCFLQNPAAQEGKMEADHFSKDCPAGDSNGSYCGRNNIHVSGGNGSLVGDIPFRSDG